MTEAVTERENILVPAPEAFGIDDIFAYALQGGTGHLDGYAHAQAHLGVEAGDLANARLKQFKETGRWVGTFEELRLCLFFEQRRWRHFGDLPTGAEAEAIVKLFAALRGTEPRLDP